MACKHLVAVLLVCLLVMKVEGRRRKALFKTRDSTNSTTPTRHKFGLHSARYNKVKPINSVDPFDIADYDFEDNQLQANLADENYEDLLFEDYQNPIMDDLADAKYLASEVCGKKLYCRRGDRGPCHRNEVFLASNSTSTTTTTTTRRHSCSSLSSYPWTGCLPSARFGSRPHQTGSCRLRFQHRPCFGYPSDYRFYGETKRCYPTFNWNGLPSSGPCSLNKIFSDVDGVNGGCRCRDRNHLLWKKDGHCYRAYSKGPCEEGDWLESDLDGYAVCRASPCPEKADGRHIYWNAPNSKEGCYKSFTVGPCKKGSYFLVEDHVRRKARCVSRYSAAPYASNPFLYPYFARRDPYPAQQRPWSPYSGHRSPWSSAYYPTYNNPFMSHSNYAFQDDDWMF